MGALYSSDGATVFLRGLLAIVFWLVTTQTCLRLPQMMKAGFWLNLAGILLITALVTLFMTPLLGKEGWQRSKVNEGYFRSAHQGQVSMQRIEGRGPDEQ
jgi:hypothetical protein